MLYQLVEDGNYDAVDNWLKANPSVSKQDLVTSLAQAAFDCSEPLVKMLLGHGADPNLRPDKHMLPLFCAVEQQDLEIVRLLVARGADVNIADECGQTALHLAVDVEGDCAQQNDEVPTGDSVALLLELGADPRRRNSTGRSPLDIAERYRFTRAIDLLTNCG